MEVELQQKVLDFAPMVKKYTWNKSEDIKSEAWLAVIEAIEFYDRTKGIPLAGYVNSMVKYSVWNMLKKQQRQLKNEISFEVEVSVENHRLIDTLANSTDITEEVEVSILRKPLFNAIKLLTERQRVVVIKSIILRYKQVDIAAELGVAPQTIFDIRKRALTRLKQSIEKYKIAAKKIIN